MRRHQGVYQITGTAEVLQANVERLRLTLTCGRCDAEELVVRSWDADLLPQEAMVHLGASFTDCEAARQGNPSARSLSSPARWLEGHQCCAPRVLACSSRRVRR